MTESFWQTRRPKSTGTRNVDLQDRVKWDIAVIGGGIVGVAAAYHLKKLGCPKVVLLEKNSVGYGATGRNAGFILAGMAEPYSRLVVAMGQDVAKELTRQTLNNHMLIRSAVEDLKMECGYRKSGSYHLATTELEKKELLQSVELLVSDGFDVVYHDEIEYSKGRKAGRFLGGFFNPSDGRIDPLAFVNGLASGLDIVEGFDARRIERSDGDVVIHGPGGSLRAEMAVLAVNGYAPLLDRFFEPLVFPVRGQMMATLPLEDKLFCTTPCYANFGYDYFRQDDSGSLIMGGLRDRFIKDELGYEDRITEPLQIALENYISDNLGIVQPGIHSRWSGLMGNTVDGLPLVGALPHNSSVLAAVGFNGHGMGLGMVVAHDLARAIMKSESSFILEKFSLKRLLGR